MCEERLQFSLSENVKTNVLWGNSIKDTVTLRPWGEQIAENSTEEVTAEEHEEEERYDLEEITGIIQSLLKMFVHVHSFFKDLSG